MGAEFVEKATPSFKKKLDRSKIELGTSDLFTRQPDPACTTAAAEIVNSNQLKIGDRVTVEAENGTLVARKGNTIVARFLKPPAILLRAVEDSCGIAKGTVEAVHIMADMVEISLC